MELPRTRALLPEVILRESSPSTNAELRELAIAPSSQPLPHGCVLVTTDQTDGRGRAGRGWVTPPDTAVAASLLLRGDAVRRVLDRLGPGWLPLIAGSAVVSALQPAFDAAGAVRSGSAPSALKRVGVKWPNDVHVRDAADTAAGRPGLKLCGILCEMLGDGSVIVGTGFNLLIDAADLPTERASSLLAAGADVRGARTLSDPAGADLADRVLAGYAEELLRLVELAGTNPAAVRDRVRADSATLGRAVRVHLPDGAIVDGRARELAADGSLVVERAGGGELTVSAGDVEHLR